MESLRLETDDLEKDFESSGKSPMWGFISRSLRLGAEVIRTEMDKLNLEEEHSFLQLFAFTQSYMLLSGLSIECAAKAVLISKDPSIIRDGKVIKGKWGASDHDLLGLVKRTGLSLSDDEVGLLKRLTEFVKWQGRYPIPLTAQDMPPNKKVTLSFYADVDAIGEWPDTREVFPPLIDGVFNRLIALRLSGEPKAERGSG